MLKNSNKNREHKCVSIKNDENLMVGLPGDPDTMKVYHKVSNSIGGK